MAQIRESRFVVQDVSPEEIELLDMASGQGVIVEREHEYYSEEMVESFNNLENGEVIDAQLQSEDVLQPNAIWRIIGWEYS